VGAVETFLPLIENAQLPAPGSSLIVDADLKELLWHKKSFLWTEDG
jgi:hypothetical protein